jgi:type I restriction enzyme S subunit
VAKFKDICTKIGSGATPKGGKEAYCEDGISLIRSQNVLDFVFSAGGLAYINELQAEKLKNVIVEEDDVLLNITGDSVARACIVDKKYLPARVNQHVCIIRADSTKAIPSYLLYYLQLNKEYLLQLASGGATRNALTKDMINNLELELPTIEEQQKIVAVLDDIQKKIDFNNAINENLQAQVMALFHAMFISSEDRLSWESGTFSDLIESTLGGDWGKESPTGNNTELVGSVK